MAIDSKFLVLTKEALKNKVSNLDSSWTTILINGDLAYSKGADAGLANNLCVNADLLKEIITGNLRYEAKTEDNFLVKGTYYTLKNINGEEVSYALKQVLDFIALLKKPYTVEFRDGSTVLYTLTIYWNSKVTKPADPTKSGYTFTGWTPSWNFNTDTLNNKNQLTSGKLIFTAQWEEESATISYLTLTCNCTSIQEGNTCTFTAPKYHWSDGTETTATGVSWSSSNTSIATISNGVVTAVSAGTATITASAGGYSDYCDITITAAPIEEEYYYRFVNISNKAIDIYLDYWATWNSTLSAGNGSANTGAISDPSYMLHIDTAPTSGYHWEINGPEGLYEYDETYGNTVYGSTDSSDPATYTISMVEDDAPSVEVTCIEYNITITAQDVAATATTANYSVTATKITHYNNGTSSTQTIPASGYTVTGASFSANTNPTPKTKTISVSINNPDSNLCSGSITTASDTFTLAAADEEPPTPTCSTYTYYITNNGATTLSVSGDINGDILAGETGTFTSSQSSITYSLLWSGSCKAEFSTLQDHYSYNGGSGTITLTYHEYRAPVISNGNTLTAGDYPDCSASITHTPEYTVVNNPTVNATNMALTLTSSLNSSISNNEIIDGYREYSYIITENSSTDPKDYSVESLGLNCSDEKSGTLGGAPDFVNGTVSIAIDTDDPNSRQAGGLAIVESGESAYIMGLGSGLVSGITIAGNLADNIAIRWYYTNPCLCDMYLFGPDGNSPIDLGLTVNVNGYTVEIRTQWDGYLEPDMSTGCPLPCS